MPPPSPQTIVVTGGAGYVGTALVPLLLARGHTVRALDTGWFGADTLAASAGHPRFALHLGDIRDATLVRNVLRGADTVIHLAAVANDQSYDLDLAQGHAVNVDTLAPMLQAAEAGGATRFIFASSSAVYGTRPEPDITEQTPTEPMTPYAVSKLEGERILLDHAGPITRVILRPATLCGYAPRMRFDLTVNVLTLHGLANGVIRVFGGDQFRSHLHVADMAAAYIRVAEAPAADVDRRIFNVGDENVTVADTARRIEICLASRGVRVAYEPVKDTRSYRVNADAIRHALGFIPTHHIEDAVRSVTEAFDAARFSSPLTNPLYYNQRQTERMLAAQTKGH